MLILEGGAGGHMRHPFDIKGVNTGEDLMAKFAQIAIEIENGNLPDTKIDGVNTSIKLVDTPSGKQFAMDRGSGDPLDVQGITVDKLTQKFEKGHGMIVAGTNVLNIFNDALSEITPELKALGLYDDSTKFFNMEYVKGTTNVLSYDHDFLKIHGVNQFYQKNTRGKPPRPGLPRPMVKMTDESGNEVKDENGNVKETPIKDPSTPVEYDKATLDSMVEKLNKYSKKYGFAVYSSIPSKPVGEFNFDVINTVQIPVTYSQGKVETKILAQRLKEAKNRIDEQIKLLDGRTIPAQGKEIYVKVLGASADDRNADPKRQTPLDKLIASPEDYQKAIDGAVFWHATRLLGDVIIDSMEVSHPAVHGPASEHEGMVITLEGDNFATKITGDFILGGQASTFRKNEPSAQETAVDAQSIRTIAIYPGRFHPFHKGHKAAYDGLAAKFGKENTFIFTSDKVELPKSPFTYQEKLIMMNAAGVDTSNVFETKQPYKAEEVLKTFQGIDMQKTILVYGVSEKDMLEDPRFAFEPLKRGPQKGQPSYLQSYNEQNVETMDKHGYVTTVPTITFNVLGQPAKSASELRAQFATLTEEQQVEFITDLYGKYDLKVHELFKQKLGAKTPIAESFIDDVFKLLLETSLAGGNMVDSAPTKISLSNNSKTTTSNMKLGGTELIAKVKERLKALEGNE